MFRLIGGTGGVLLIFALPGALLVQYAMGKGRDGAAWGAGEPLLGSEVQQLAQQQQHGNYNFLQSKLFWSGVMLLVGSALCMLLTVANVLTEPKAPTAP